MSATYDVGDKIRVTATFRDSTGALTDPSALTFKTRTPTGGVTTLTYGVSAQPIRSSIGIYYADVDLTSAGTWGYRYNATGTGQAAAEGAIVAKPTVF